MDNLTITRGLSDQHRQEAAALYMEAFGSKIGGVLGRDARAVGFIAEMLDGEHGLSAVSARGELLGIAGFKTPKGSFVGGELDDLMRNYGRFGGLWRGLVLSVLERKLERDCLMMDGICVAEEARGRGVGSALLDAIVAEARARELSVVRLDVIDTNLRARALYKRKGFVEGRTEQLGVFSHVFGFRSATTMRLAV